MEFVAHLIPPGNVPSLPNDIWREVTNHMNYDEERRLLAVQLPPLEVNVANNIQHINALAPYLAWRNEIQPAELRNARERLAANEERINVVNRQIQARIYVHNWIRQINN